MGGRDGSEPEASLPGRLPYAAQQHKRQERPCLKTWWRDNLLLNTILWPPCLHYSMCALPHIHFTQLHHHSLHTGTIMFKCFNVSVETNYKTGYVLSMDWILGESFLWIIRSWSHSLKDQEGEVYSEGTGLNRNQTVLGTETKKKSKLLCLVPCKDHFYFVQRSWLCLCPQIMCEIVYKELREALKGNQISSD